MVSSFLRDEILWVSFSDPSSRNAFSIAAARELRAVLKSQFRALVFSAPGRVFCSGGQLDDYASMTSADEGRVVNDEIRDVLNELSSLKVPTIACVTGDAFGGGVELISCFDHVLSVPHAMFALWQRRIGLSFGWGGGARLEKRLGSNVLRHMSLSTTAISAHEALSVGLVDMLVAEHALESSVATFASRLIHLPSEPIETLKSFTASEEASDFNSLWWNLSHRSVLASRKR